MRIDTIGHGGRFADGALEEDAIDPVRGPGGEFDRGGEAVAELRMTALHERGQRRVAQGSGEAPDELAPHQPEKPRQRHRQEHHAHPHRRLDRPVEGHRRPEAPRQGQRQ